MDTKIEVSEYSGLTQRQGEVMWSPHVVNVGHICHLCIPDSEHATHQNPSDWVYPKINEHKVC